MSVTKTPLVSPSIRTLADLQDRLGHVPLERIRFYPPPGTATLADIWQVARREDRLCELIEGVLVERAPGFTEAVLTTYLATRLVNLIIPDDLGVVTGASGMVELRPGLVRSPDVAFTAWDRMPGRRIPSDPIPRLAPNLIADVPRPGNTAAELAIKRRDYFTAGVDLIWIVDRNARTVTAFTAPDSSITLGSDDTLHGAPVLPGFSLPLRQLFAELDRHG